MIINLYKIYLYGVLRLFLDQTEIMKALTNIFVLLSVVLFYGEVVNAGLFLANFSKQPDTTYDYLADPQNHQLLMQRQAVASGSTTPDKESGHKISSLSCSPQAVGNMTQRDLELNIISGVSKPKRRSRYLLKKVVRDLFGCCIGGIKQSRPLPSVQKKQANRPSDSFDSTIGHYRNDAKTITPFLPHHENDTIVLYHDQNICHQPAELIDADIEQDLPSMLLIWSELQQEQEQKQEQKQEPQILIHQLIDFCTTAINAERSPSDISTLIEACVDSMQKRIRHYDHRAFAALATLIQLWSLLPDDGDTKRSKLQQWLLIWPAAQWLPHQPEKLVLSLSAVHDMPPEITSEACSKNWLYQMLSGMPPCERKAIKHITLACLAKTPQTQLSHLRVVRSIEFKHPHLLQALQEELQPLKGGDYQEYMPVYEDLLMKKQVF